MRVLVLGGTGFLGRHIVEAALQGGHEVTVFNRGTTAPPTLPVEQLIGNRDDGQAPSGSWDLVFDTARNPRWVRDAVEAVDAGHWTYVSTISVYADFSQPPVTEETPLREPGGDRYDDRKVACEAELPGGALVVRPGSIVGPWDDIGRLAYWVARIAEGGEVLVPDVRDQPVQMIDVRDLAAWMVAMAERGERGVYNATGPGIPFADVLAAIPGDAELAWVDPEWLEAQGVESWTDLPLWVGTDPSDEGFMRVDSSRAVAKGLEFRPLADTIEATRGLKGSGMSREREAELLAAWRAARAC